MQSPRAPANESERIAELRRFEILDTEADEFLDTLTELAAEIMDVPIALVSLVDVDRQWFKSRVGLAIAQTPRDVSFCGHVVADGTPMVIDDAFADPRFADNPLVTGDPHVRFYAGFPLRTDSGFDLGTLCTIDHRPRQPSDKQLRMLGRIATLVVQLITSRHQNAIVRHVVDSVPGMLAYWDQHQRCRFANAAYQDWFGISPEALRGKTMEELLGPIYPRNRPYIEAALRGESQSFERDIPDQQAGPPRASQAHYLPHCVDGNVLGFVVMVTDISNRKRLETELATKNTELVATHEHSEHESETARRLLDRMLQRGHFDPARVRIETLTVGAFGGDIVLGHDQPDRRYRWLVGDATGHTLASTLVSLPTAMVFYAMSHDDHPLAHVVVTIDNELHAMLPANMFFAAAICELDRARGTLTVINVGGPPVIVRTTTGEMKLFASDGAPLGLLPSQPVVRTLAVAPGDRVYTFTDGLTEVCDPRGALFGIDSVGKALASTSPDRAFDALAAAWRAHMTIDGALDDDLTIVEVVV